MKPQRQWGHSGEEENQRLSGLLDAVPLWMIKGFIISLVAEIDLRIKYQPIKLFINNKGDLIYRLKIISLF